MEALLSLIPKVFERVVGLLKHKAEERRHFFDAHIEPVFQDLRTVHEDYLAGINEVDEALSDSSRSLSEVREQLLKAKLQLEHLRQLIGDAIRMLLGDPALTPPDPDQEYLDVNAAAYVFAAAVYEYFQFSTGDPMHANSPYSHYKGLVGLIQHAIEDRTPREIVALQVKGLLGQLPDKWAAVSRAYVDLKTQCHQRI